MGVGPESDQDFTIRSAKIRLASMPSREVVPRKQLAFFLPMRIDVNPRWRVVIVDDRALSKAAVAEAVATLERYRPDVVVLALGLPDGSGAEELKSGLDAVRRENEDLKKALESRKLVERAKGVLMERHGLSEAEAFRRIQKTAMDSRRPMIEVARALLLVERLEGVPSGRRQSSPR